MIIFLEIFANFFKLSGLMGIESGLIYNKSGIHYLKPNSTGAVFEKKFIPIKMVIEFLMQKLN